MANYSYSYEAYGAYPYTNAQYGNTSPARIHARMTTPRRASTPKETKRIDDAELVVGHVFWLPPKEELPPRAVRRAHGKGAVEEGIYNHPVVVISRPAEEPEVVHFHIVSVILFTRKSTPCSLACRSLPSKVNDYTRYTLKTMSFMLRAAHGTSQYHHLLRTQMQLPRRCRRGFQPWNCNMAQTFVGTHT